MDARVKPAHDAADSDPPIHLLNSQRLRRPCSLFGPGKPISLSILRLMRAPEADPKRQNSNVSKNKVKIHRKIFLQTRVAARSHECSGTTMVTRPTLDQAAGVTPY